MSMLALVDLAFAKLGADALKPSVPSGGGDKAQNLAVRPRPSPANYVILPL